MGSWWESADSVRYVTDWLQSLTAWFTVITALFGVAMLITQRRMAQLEPPQAELFARVSGAQAAAASAEAKAAAADKRVSEAETRATSAEAATAKAREEQAEREKQLRAEVDRANAEAEKIKAALAPRHLSAEQRQQFLAFRPERRGKAQITISAPMSDPEAIAFSDELAALLIQAGWKVETTMNQFVLPPKGLTIVTNDAKDQSAAWLQRALQHIGFDAPGEDAKGKMTEPLQLIVGHKR